MIRRPNRVEGTKAAYVCEWQVSFNAYRFASQSEKLETVQTVPSCLNFKPLPC